jgi:hypothetical protein
VRFSTRFIHAFARVSPEESHTHSSPIGESRPPRGR